MLNMADKWTKYKLSELGFLGRGKSKHRPRNDISLFGGSYPFIQTGEIKAANLYISNYEQTYNEKGLAQSKLWNEGTLCMTIAANIAETAILKIKACFPDSIVGFVADNKLCNVYFIKYYIDFIKNKMQSVSGGACQDNLSLDKIAYFDIEAPKKKIQDKIAKILSNYDDLIENNNKRIKILEEMAQKIYKEWFVDFKFPNHETATFKDSELGKIPSDWEISTLENILSGIESGSRPKGGINPNDKEIPSIGAENILGLGKYDYNKEKYISNDFYEKMKKGKVKDLDVLLYKDGAQLGRKSIFGENFPHSKCCINEHVFILRTNPKCSPYYLYFTLDTIENTERIKQLNTNAAQPGINQKQVKGLTIILPLKKYIEKFDNVVKPIVSQIFKLCIKNQTFKQTRELLLPRLISGEIDVENLNIL